MVSVRAAAALITLLSLCLMATHTSAAYYHCCRRYMTFKLPFRAVRGYSIQTQQELCPINAIIFHTKKGKTCTDPALTWVMDYIDRIRSKAQMVHTKNARV